MVASATRAPYEEIHFMFIGNDTTRIYMGYYTNGQAYQSGPVTLNFHTNEKYHSYAFQWTADFIKWYVDDVEVTSEMGSRPIPTTPNRFVVSFLGEVSGTVNDDSVTNTSPDVYRNFEYVPHSDSSALLTFIQGYFSSGHLYQYYVHTNPNRKL